LALCNIDCYNKPHLTLLNPTDLGLEVPGTDGGEKGGSGEKRGAGGGKFDLHNAALGFCSRNLQMQTQP